MSWELTPLLIACAIIFLINPGMVISGLLLFGTVGGLIWLCFMIGPGWGLSAIAAFGVLAAVLLPGDRG